jgi:DNA-binding beta-propeller fold protein YncE/mono/diheme cytochrome c family protein
MRKRLLLGAVGLLAACSAGDAPSGSVFRGKIAVSEGSPDGGGVPIMTSGAPILGPTVSLDDAPPPIFGGTLLVTDDDQLAIVADPDRDAIHVVDVAGRKLLGAVATSHHAYPFRAAEGPGGTVYVTLRGTGELLAFDRATRATLWTSPVCDEPRGLAFDPETSQVVVACETGEIARVAPTGQVLARTLVQLDGVSAGVRPRLRDVFIDGAALWVSDFRDARMLHVGATGIVDEKLETRSRLVAGDQGDFAWRARRLGPKRFLLSHHIAETSNLKIEPSGYGGPCSSRVGSFVTMVEPDQAFPGEIRLVASALPTDVAVRDDGAEYLVALPGNSASPVLPQFAFIGAKALSALACDPVVEGTPVPPSPARLDAQIVAASYLHGGGAVVQSREPARLYFLSAVGAITATVELSSVSRRDTGHELFHANTGHALACASCHAEGGDDGRTWTLRRPMQAFPRRTPSLRGTLAGTAPYHWNGEEANLDALFADVMRERMRGPVLDVGQREAFRRWLEGLGAPPRAPATDADAADRGRALFLGTGKCASCHGEAGIPDSEPHDVGKEEPLQAPSLTGLRFRAPYMHDGCASTLEQRFQPACGGAKHGGALTPAQTSDVIVYLRTL